MVSASIAHGLGEQSVALAAIADAFEESLREQVSEMAIVGRLKDSVSYALLGGGKRIRPLFALGLMSDLTGHLTPQSYRLVAPLEMVHCASLAHDDLPALDNDDVRRGKPSLHRAFDEGTALLCGDYLVPAAFAVLSSSSLGDAATRALTRSLAEAYSSVCYGQELDRAPHISREDLCTVHRHKTAALFACAAEFAGVITEQSVQRVQELHVCGTELGMYFQFVDDFLDRDDGGPNLTAGQSLPEALASLDKSLLRVEQAIMRLEGLCQLSTMSLTREILGIIRAQL